MSFTKRALLGAGMLLAAAVWLAPAAGAMETNPCQEVVSDVSVNQAQDCATYVLEAEGNLHDAVMKAVCEIISDEPENCKLVNPL